MRSLLAFLLFAQAAVAQDISATAASLYERMPETVVVERIAGNCGADQMVNPRIAYCTSLGQIFVARDAAELSEAPYELAHQYGHAIFVRHGLADLALAAIRADRGREAFLRGQVTRQIECLAGVLFARAGHAPASLLDWYETEPFVGSHWGRDPLAIGPKVTVSLAERDAWFRKGQAARHPSACEVPELPVELLIDPFQG